MHLLCWCIIVMFFLQELWISHHSPKKPHPLLGLPVPVNGPHASLAKAINQGVPLLSLSLTSAFRIPHYVLMASPPKVLLTPSTALYLHHLLLIQTAVHHLKSTATSWLGPHMDSGSLQSAFHIGARQLQKTNPSILFFFLFLYPFPFLPEQFRPKATRWNEIRQTSQIQKATEKRMQHSHR